MNLVILKNRGKKKNEKLYFSIKNRLKKLGKNVNHDTTIKK